MSEKIKTSNWRKTAIAIYKSSKDGKVYGTYEVDATNLLKFIENKKRKGIRITVTNLVTAAIARALYYDIPEMNCFVRRGKLVKRENIDVFLAVATKGKSVTGLIIPKAENMTVTEIAEYQTNKLEKIKSKQDNSFKIKDTVAKIPWPFQSITIRIVKWWIFDMGFPFVKLNKSPFSQ